MPNENYAGSDWRAGLKKTAKAPTCNECVYNGGGTFCRKYDRHIDLGQYACSEIMQI